MAKTWIKRSPFLVSGIPELDAKFEKMEKNMKRNLVTKAMRKGAKITLQYAKAFAPVDEGLLRKSLSVVNVNVSKRNRARGMAGVKIAVRKSKREIVPYQMQAEIGTRDRTQQGTHFLRRAKEASKAQVINIFKNEITTYIKQQEMKGG